MTRDARSIPKNLPRRWSALLHPAVRWLKQTPDRESYGASPTKKQGQTERRRKQERERHNGPTVICEGRKVDSGVRTAQLSADENEP